MVQNTNQASIPASGTPQEICGADVDAFMQTVGAWARSLPPREQALLNLVLATAASVEHADVSEWLAGFPMPNPRDVIVAATGSSTGAQSGEVVGHSAGALDSDLSDTEVTGAAGAALARALLNVWGEGQR